MAAIPRRVCMTSKCGFPHQPKWAATNEGCEMVLHDDAQALRFVTDNYPEYLEVYTALGHPVERADLWRYLIVHKLGGVYADMDVQPLANIGEWLSKFGYTHGESNFSAERLLVCGMEFMRPEGENPLQIVQWTFASTAPGHPLLKCVVDEVVKRAKTMPYSKDNVCARTGPGAWTAAILSFLKAHGHEEAAAGGLIAAAEPRGAYFTLADDEGGAPWGLVVLPYRAFGFHPWHGDDVVKEPREQHLVHHDFAGTWR